ncbi:PIN domain-containing protein [Mycobacteroides abscessus subsp. abscessus]|uniref:DUF4935 domain-containing protein n=2 Tax=Mycobacteroides TaxID=670516 RepID=A0AB73MAW9_MYCCH|nr:MULTISPECIES: PIN domain-containing protein [Mycobacteroides]OHT55208.1 hypothetical protein BKG62_03280 [Mycobacteroides chelonae]OHT58500.1 hypothetical protein BKG64_17545 [Mycobacteroides chelonae]OHT64701.1 hypothetical protein BKG65_08680 [Mycobacteroides chelonae]OHT67563.1 hypothetical protein BKG66_23140 [Mycobacteroides chelonae]OHT69206.1 hypothetical protein BKG67_21680 [Mycobacteroides chelonae]
MSTVIVVDTNVLVESPRLQRPEWISLIEHAADWDVQIMVPEVVFMETVNKVREAWRHTGNELNKLKLGTFGVAQHVDTITSSITNHSEDYEDWLRDYCRNNDIAIASLPAIDAMDIARRACEGRAPFKGTKDSYRDTLIWLTVLSISADASDADVWLVSQNTSDFGASGKAGRDEREPQHPLHDDLVEELAEQGLRERVRYVASIKRLEQHIAAQFAPIDNDELAKQVNGIHMETLASKLVDAITDLNVHPETTALPTEVVNAKIIGAREPMEGWRFTEAARRGQAGWTAQFAVEVETDLSLIGAALVSTEHTKTLTVKGQVSIAPDGSIADLVVDSIEALPNDPMRDRWIRRNDRTTTYSAHGILGQTDELLRTISNIQASLSSPPYADLLHTQQEARAKLVQNALGIGGIATSLKARQDEIARSFERVHGFRSQLDEINDAVRKFKETFDKQMRPAYESISALYKSPAIKSLRRLNRPAFKPITNAPTYQEGTESERRSDEMR